MRHPDWQLKFAAYTAARQAMPFTWGTNDCALFAVGVVKAMTGIDHAVGIRGYKTALGAAKRVEKLGGLFAIATKALGAAVSPLQAGVGDVVLCDNEGRELLAVCNGTTALCPGAAGLTTIDINAAKAAWKV